MTRQLNDAENTLRLKMGAHARKAALDAGLEAAADAPLSPEVLDQLWSEWDWSTSTTDEEKKVAIAFFGFAFGEYLAAGTGMQWRVVSDEYGEDYGLVLPATDVTAFPLATVGKRLGGNPFFSAIAPAMIKDVQSPKRRLKPWWKIW